MLQRRCFRVLVYFVLLVVTIEAKSIKQSDGKEPFELEEFFYGLFSARSFNGTWITADTFYYKDYGGDVNIFDLNTKESKLFLEKSVLASYRGAIITVSPDLLYLLIRYNVSAVFRHSTTAIYAIYDLENGQYYDVADKKPIQIAQWSPDGHGLVYVYDNNIYYLESPSVNAKTVTTTGVSGTIYNGVPDWVYEEEVLGSGSAFWFSPNGKQIAFASFDDREVDDFRYFHYGKAGDVSDPYQYPEEVVIKYPKVGRTNPRVRTFIASLETDKEDSIAVSELNVIPEPSDNYVLYGMTWATDEEIAILYTNRVQNEGKLVRCNREGICQDEAAYKEEKGWLEVHMPRYSKDGTLRLEILPQPEPDDYYDRLVLTDVKTNVAKKLTLRPIVVTDIYGWDQKNNLIYFLGYHEMDSTQRQVYVVDTVNPEVKCLTCKMELPEGLCKYASASFSKDWSRVVKICQGPGPTLVEIHNLQDDSDVVVWEDNRAVRDKLALKLLPKVKNLRARVDGGFTANVRLLLPPGLDENSSKKYPAVVNVYAGPNSNQINDAYSSGFQNYIVTNREYIYIYIDGRGSGRSGQSNMFQVYRNLGTVEIEDQIAVTKYLQDTLPYIDATKTGIWGWSYGGFASAWALIKDKENVFKFALSVAPVTNFIYYDSIYTERYMGLPSKDDNEAGYNNTDITRNVEAMRGKLFFLIHGNADDNVHYQQSMLLAKALELADIPFQQQSYPDENHSLGHVYPHLYHTIDRFWARSFDLPDPPTARLKSKSDIDSN